MSKSKRDLTVLRVLLACSAMALASAASAQQAESYKETAAERAACTGDVYRLCKRYIPSRSGITGCLERSNELSSACEAVIHGGGASARIEAEARPRRDPRE